MTVSAEQRAALARAVSGLRRIFEADYAALAEGKFGIHLAGRRAGEIEDANALSLSAHDLAARHELVGVVEYLRGEGLGAREAVERMVREAVFTTVNRLLAIRVAEAIGVLPPSLAEGIRSEGFSEAVEAFPLLRGADDSGGYWTYLQICGDELSHTVPRLFDRRHPLSAFVPSAEDLDRAVEILTDPALVDVWIEPEALGWSYQFFNTQDERRAMREASSAPRNARELAVRNQFFTPGYVVDFLVQNTLGRRLRESGFNLELPLLLGNVDEGAPPIDLDDLAVLDPAVGSGHFLLGAYGLLEKAWAEREVPPADAAQRILQSLYGIEIDPRAAQVAQTVLMLRARQSAPSGSIAPPAIVTARPLPKDPVVRSQVLDSADDWVRDLVEGLDGLLSQAPVLGSLLDPSEYLRGLITDRMQRPRLADGLPSTYADAEITVLTAAERIAREASSSTEERLFAADARDALGFVEVAARRYDVVLMNPPFGSPVEETKRHLRDSFSTSAVDLYAAFVHRGVELLKPGASLGAITNRSGLFLTTLGSWRSEVVLPRLVSVLDLGFGVLEEALVEAAAYVLRSEPRTGPIGVRSLLKEPDKARATYALDGPCYQVEQEELNAIPGSPLAYWVADAFRHAYREFPPLEESEVDVRAGAYSGDDGTSPRELDTLTKGVYACEGSPDGTTKRGIETEAEELLRRVQGRRGGDCPYVRQAGGAGGPRVGGG